MGGRVQQDGQCIGRTRRISREVSKYQLRRFLLVLLTERKSGVRWEIRKVT